MGAYINPPGEAKEAFLFREGRPLSPKEARNWNFSNRQELPVALVDNGPFTAAGVSSNAKDLQTWFVSSDHRPRLFFAVAITKLSDPNQSGIPAGNL